MRTACLLSSRFTVDQSKWGCDKKCLRIKLSGTTESGSGRDKPCEKDFLRVWDYSFPHFKGLIFSHLQF